MSDQARQLREYAAMNPRPPFEEPPPARAIVMGSGKGGVGKSALAVLFASALSRRGLRVLLIDAAQNHGNLHVLLGVRPMVRIDALLSGEIDPGELAVPLSGTLAVVPSDTGAQSTYQLSSLDRARIQDRIATLYPRYDFVVIDGGPGIEGAVRATLGASRMMVVTVPEPASLSDAYALIKIAHLQMPSVATDVLVNRTAAGGECEAVFQRLALGARKFLRRELSLIGEVPEDEALRLAVREPARLLDITGPAVEAVDRMAARLALAPVTAGSSGEDSCPA